MQIHLISCETQELGHASKQYKVQTEVKTIKPTSPQTTQTAD